MTSHRFDPADELIVKDEKRRKKSTSMGKASQVEVCLLPHFMERVPKGKHRTDLKDKGRLKKVSVSRQDLWPTITKSIQTTFGDVYTKMTVPTVLSCDGTALSKAHNQKPDGDIVNNRRGSFYISDGAPEDPICLTVSIKFELDM